MVMHEPTSGCGALDSHRIQMKKPFQTHVTDRRIDIDDDLITKAMAATGLTTKKATVEEALRRLILRRERLDALADLSGLGWDDDLAASREGRDTPPLPNP